MIRLLWLCICWRITMTVALTCAAPSLHTWFAPSDFTSQLESVLPKMMMAWMCFGQANSIYAWLRLRTYQLTLFTSFKLLSFPALLVLGADGVSVPYLKNLWCGTWVIKFVFFPNKYYAIRVYKINIHHIHLLYNILVSYLTKLRAKCTSCT